MEEMRKKATNFLLVSRLRTSCCLCYSGRRRMKKNSIFRGVPVMVSDSPFSPQKEKSKLGRHPELGITWFTPQDCN